MSSIVDIERVIIYLAKGVKPKRKSKKTKKVIK